MARRYSETLVKPRPVIKLPAGGLHQSATEAETALIDGGAPLYVRGDGLVRPVVDEVEASDDRRTKIARLTSVTSAMLVDHLSRHADWRVFRRREKDWIPTDPPRALADIILARDGEWRLPRLAGVITCPTMRRDGSILSTPGYDRETGLLLLDPPALPSIPMRPTRQDAADALGVLDGLLDGFPFVGDASRSVALSALITPIVRGALSAAPLHAVRAPTAGTGKSYLIDTACTILTGQPAPVIAAGKTEEETEKRLASALMAGQPFISIDNVNGRLAGDLLCQMIERPLVEVRELGRSRMIRIENRATVFANGNNIEISGDMVRRVVLCSLDANMERPETRSFRSDPCATVNADRGRFIAAALTIVRAFIEAGSPGALDNLASFGSWSRLVRSAIVWLGRADPVETMDIARAEDTSLTGLRAVVVAWRDVIGIDAPRLAGELKTAAEQTADDGRLLHPDLRAALMEVAASRNGQGVDATKMGHFLKRSSGRIVDGLKIVGELNSHSRTKEWSLRSVE
jgi:putative DNA primase/helicase